MPIEPPVASDIQTPLVSFIVTAYNLSPLLLRECLQTLLDLSLSPQEREIILVDDGSETSPLTELSDIADEILYVRERNHGLSVARNTGIRLARGNFIQFVDGDDHLLQAPYEHCLDIVRYHQPDMVFFRETHKQRGEVSFSFEGPVLGNAYLHNHNLRASACGYIFRRNILGNLRFVPGILHEDEAFTPQLCLRAERVYDTNAEAYFYRKRQQSITHATNKLHRLRRLTDMERIIAGLQDLGDTLPEADRVGLQRRIAQLSMDYLYQTILLTRSGRHLDRAIGFLRRRGLFPLPDKNYTKKYRFFRIFIRSWIGRRLLIFTSPRL